MYHKIKNQLSNLPYWIAGLITGSLAALYAFYFKKLAIFSFSLFQNHFSTWAILVPVGFTASWFSVKYFSPEASGSGIPQVLASLRSDTPSRPEWYQKLLGLKVVLIKIVSSLASVIVGGAVGREGPTIQIGAGIFNFILPFVSKKNHDDENKKRKALILAGGAAGIAAAFNTPLGGIVFAIEELATDSFRQFRSTVLLAVIVAGMTAQWISGAYLYLGHPDVAMLRFSISFLSLGVAATGGLLGGVFGVTLFRLIQWRKNAPNLSSHLTWLAILSGLFILLAHGSHGLSLGPGTEGITDLMSHHSEASFFDVLTRYLANQISYLVGGAGGIFSPSLSIGANLGSFLGGLFLSDGPSINLMVIVGMVSFLTGVTHAPFTSLVLVLEMMDQPSLTAPVMLGTLVAHAFAKLIHPHSFYERMSETFKA